MSFSTFVTYCLPLTSFISSILALFALILPTSQMRHNALTTLTTRSTNSNMDGPNIWLGLFLACWRTSDGASTNCSGPSFVPRIEDAGTIFTHNVARSLVDRPKYTGFFTVFCCISIALMFIHTGLIGCWVLHHLKEAWFKFMDNRIMKLFLVWSAVTSLYFGQGFLMLYLWFNKTAHDFNAFVELHGQVILFNLKLKVVIGGCFIMTAIAYAFMTVSLVAMAVAYVLKPKSDGGGDAKPSPST